MKKIIEKYTTIINYESPALISRGFLLVLMGLSDAHTTCCAKGGEDGSGHGGDNLHNPLKSLFLSQSSLKFNVSEI